MNLYRVVQSGNNITNNDFKGVNTFNYAENEEYLHFFILPEHAEIYKQLKYTNNSIPSLIYKVDIPYEVIKDCFGAGMYTYYQPKVKNAFLEVRIKKQDFDKKYIVDQSENIKTEWKNNEIFQRYLYNCVRNDFIITEDYKYVEKCQPVNILSYESLKVEINKDFNFLHYFSQNDLKKENINVVDYPQKLEEIEGKIIKKNKRVNLYSKLKKLSLKTKQKQDEQDKTF